MCVVMHEKIYPRGKDLDAVLVADIVIAYIGRSR